MNFKARVAMAPQFLLLLLLLRRHFASKLAKFHCIWLCSWRDRSQQ
jgi:hypothetical protein